MNILIHKKAQKEQAKTEKTELENKWQPFIEQHQKAVKQLKEKGKHHSLVINAFGRSGSWKVNCLFSYS